MRRINIVIKKINPTRPICNALFDKEHSHRHRMLVGAIVMGVGVVIAKSAGHHELQLIAYVGDVIGYGVHGLGLTPYIEYIIDTLVEDV